MKEDKHGQQSLVESGRISWYGLEKIFSDKKLLDLICDKKFLYQQQLVTEEGILFTVWLCVNQAGLKRKIN